MAIQTTSDIYKYTAELQYVKGNEAVTIDAKYIKNIMIDYDYDKLNMPMIFVTLSLDKSLLDDMIANSDTALINMTIYKYISNSDTPNINTVYIREQFVYFIPDNMNARKNLDMLDERYENKELFKIVSMGLLKLDLINNNKKHFNGVINNTTMVNMIYHCIGHMPALIEPLTYNKSLNQVILPPITSVAKAIAYLNNISVFYDTPYRFFMDLDTTYLLSSSGKPVPKKGEDINSILINVRGLTDGLETDQGMYTDKAQKLHSFELIVTDLESNINNVSEKSFNNITAMTSSGNIDNASLNINNSSYIKSKSKLVRLPNDNTNLLKNIKANLEDDAVTLEINKNDIDASVININREISVKTHGLDTDFQIYDGKYLLKRKRELFIREDEAFICNVMLTLKKINT